MNHPPWINAVQVVREPTMSAFAAAARVGVAPRVSTGVSRHTHTARVPNTAAAPLAPRRAGAPPHSVITRAVSSPDTRMSDSEYSEFRAEDAIKRAVEGWKKLDDTRGVDLEDLQTQFREADRTLSDTRRRAAADSDASAEKLRVAEAAAALWEGRAKEVRRDLEFKQKQLEELQRSSSGSSYGGSGGGGSSSYGSSYGGSTTQSGTEREALAKAEDAHHRLRQGEQRAGEQAKAALRDLEELKRGARESQQRAEERIRGAESSAAALERASLDKDKELILMREALARDLNASHKDLQTARAAVSQRDNVISELGRARDDAIACANDRENVIVATRGDLDKAHATLHERDGAIEILTRECDEARHLAWDREQHIHVVEKERDGQAHLAWERENVIKERDASLVERENERDAARHEAWERQETIVAKDAAFAEMESIAKQLAARAIAGKEHKHK